MLNIRGGYQGSWIQVGFQSISFSSRSEITSAIPTSTKNQSQKKTYKRTVPKIINHTVQARLQDAGLPDLYSNLLIGISQIFELQTARRYHLVSR